MGGIMGQMTIEEEYAQLLNNYWDMYRLYVRG